MIAVAAAFAAPAGADQPAEPEFEYTPAYEFERPKGLAPNHDVAMKLSENLLQQEHFGGIPATVVADASVGDGWAFYVFDISATDPAPEPERMIRDSFHRLRTGSGQVLSWEEAVEDDMATATMEWRYDDTETLSMVRTHMWVTSTGAPHELRAECIMPEDRADELRPRCADAFAALAVKAPDRGALGPLPTATEPAAQPGRGDAAPSTGASLRPPTDGAVVYQSKPTRTPEKDNTFLYVGGAILLVVAVYMAMRRSPDAEEDGEQESPDE